MNYPFTLLCTVATLAITLQLQSTFAFLSLEHGFQYLGPMRSRMENGSYIISTYKTNQLNATNDCKTIFGGRLLSVLSEEESDHIHDLLKTNFTIFQNIRTSGRRENLTSPWSWASLSSPIEYTNWRSFQPANDSSTKTCLIIYGPSSGFYGWESFSCTSNEYFICEAGDKIVPTTTTVRPTAAPCTNRSDLVFALDGSGSVSAPDFILGKEFVAELAAAFTIVNTSRVGYLVVSSSVATVVPLNNNLSQNQLIAAILTASQPRSGTATHLAINGAISQLNSSPVGVPRNLVVLTDGVSDNPSATASSAANAKNLGIVAFAVGIGPGANQQELLAIAGGNPAHVYIAPNFEAMKDIIEELSKEICES